jgi:hypothetical protein
MLRELQQGLSHRSPAEIRNFNRPGFRQRAARRDFEGDYGFLEPVVRLLSVTAGIAVLAPSL